MCRVHFVLHPTENVLHVISKHDSCLTLSLSQFQCQVCFWESKKGCAGRGSVLVISACHLWKFLFLLSSHLYHLYDSHYPHMIERPVVLFIYIYKLSEDSFCFCDNFTLFFSCAFIHVLHFDTTGQTTAYCFMSLLLLIASFFLDHRICF